MKNDKLPKDVDNTDADQTVPKYWLQNISLIVFNHFRPPY